MYKRLEMHIIPYTKIIKINIPCIPQVQVSAEKDFVNVRS